MSKMGSNTDNFGTDFSKINSNYFVRMMLPDAESIAKDYIREEEEKLIELVNKLKKIQEFNFIVIGAGALWYVDIVYSKVKRYISIEPHTKKIIQKPIQYLISKHDNLLILEKEFGSFDKELLPSGKNLYVFHFNILAYIDRPIHTINMYIKPGDIIYISSWNKKSNKSMNVRKKYFDYLNFNTPATEYRVDPEDTNGLCDINDFPFHKLKHYKSNTRVRGEITDILIINC